MVFSVRVSSNSSFRGMVMGWLYIGCLVLGVE